MKEHQLTVLQPAAVEVLWPDLYDLLYPAEKFAHGEFLIEDILPMVQDEKAFIAVMSHTKQIELAVVFEVMVYPRKTILHVLAMGGKGFDVIMNSCWTDLERLAKCVGASSIRAAVRPSMLRYARRVAPEAKEVYTVVERPLGE
jgi:hypothetical protein